MKPEDLNAIDLLFYKLKNGGIEDRKATCTTLGVQLKDIFSKDFDVRVIENVINTPFVMTVIPHTKTTDNIIKSLTDDKETTKDVVTLWKECKMWLVEIDERILDYTLSDKELTALLLHEVNHVLNSDEVPTKIAASIKYAISCSDFKEKTLLKRPMMRKILSIPITNACMFSNNSISIKRELKENASLLGDVYVSNMLSAITKLSSINTSHDDIDKTITFSIKCIEDVYSNGGEAAKHNLNKLKDALPECCMKECVSDIEDSIFKPFSKNVMREEVVFERVENYANKIIEDSYMREFFDIGKKKLKEIKQNELDYVSAKMQDMQSIDDKILLMSYINSKLDMIEYYLEIINNPKIKKRYIIPNSESQLVRFKNQLIECKNYIMKYKLPDKKDELIAWYPSGYEG